jgi:uncharacterized protein YpbB
MESKIAERINHEISGSPFAVYRMIPAFNGADIIGVTTIEKFEEVMRMFNEIEHVQEFLDSQPDKTKTMVLPGIELPIGIAINKARGAVIDHSIEVELSNEGYLIVE